ncbi:MAG: hypothetical protein GY934_13535 [Gammaproteobacteria bacterium]|nr:hypothetical protein [Gammaproteobacteria bacterium]
MTTERKITILVTMAAVLLSAAAIWWTITDMHSQGITFWWKNLLGYEPCKGQQ